MSNWEKFKKRDSPSGEDKPEGIMVEMTLTCQFCFEFVMEGKYFPTDSVLSYKCSKGHLSIIEKFSYM